MPGNCFNIACQRIDMGTWVQMKQGRTRRELTTAEVGDEHVAVPAFSCLLKNIWGNHGFTGSSREIYKHV